jgi:hypothetical protein
LGGYRKIFVKSEEQFQEYRKYYEFAEELYMSQNRLTGVPMNSNSHYLIPFIKDPKDSAKKRKEKRESSLYSSALQDEKKLGSAKVDLQKSGDK